MTALLDTIDLDALAVFANTEILKYGPPKDTVSLFGVRGFFKNTLKEPSNEIGVWDDLIVVIAPNSFRAFVANTDPTRDIVGRATLQPGKWRFRKGIHNESKNPAVHPRYPALVEDGEFRVFRYGTGKFPKNTVRDDYGYALGNQIWSGWFGINIHHSVGDGTSSAGCQTIQEDQWNDFYTLVTAAMDAAKQPKIYYVLTTA